MATGKLVPTIPQPAALARPVGLGDDEWSAIQEARDRLVGAVSGPDLPLVVGSAKELCEAVAKVVIAERGGTTTGGLETPELLNLAHRRLEHQPGEGIASDPDVRQLAQGLKSIVLGLAGVRNRHGTGHGRAGPTGITAEHAVLAVMACDAWCAWALRRLEPYIEGDVTALVRDLDDDVFRQGELSRRLTVTNLRHLDAPDQFRLGVAVARRGSRRTFVVIADGIAAIDLGDPFWPEGYAMGVVSGLLFDANAYFDIAGWKVEHLVQILVGVAQSRDDAAEILAKATEACEASRVRATLDAMRDASAEIRSRLPMAGWLTESWRRLADAIDGFVAARSS
jgi:hypothetical protein